MSKDKNNVVARLRSKIKPENRIFVKKNLAISEQIEVLRKEKGWSQKELAKQLDKTESEVSRMLSGLHNITLKSISKLEAVFGNDIIITPLQACEKYKTVEYLTIKEYIPVPQSSGQETDYEEQVAYQKSRTIKLNAA